MGHQANGNVGRAMSRGQWWREQARSPRGGALLAALLVLVVLLPLLILATRWYPLQVSNGQAIQQSLVVFEISGLIVILLLTGFTYLVINRQARLSLAVRERTAEITRINQQLEASAARRKEVEAELRALFAAMTDAILVVDAQGRYLQVAPTNPDLRVRPADELLGKTVQEVVPAAQAEAFLGYIQEALRTHQAVHYEERLMVRGGEKWFGATVSPLSDDSVLLVGRDITERKQAEAALREREEQYRSVFESSTDGLFINDLSGRLVDFNPAAAHLHGYSIEEFRHLQPAQFIHPASLHLFQDYIETVKRGEHFRCQAIDLRKDGTPFHVDVLGIRFTYRGEPHALAVLRDITEQVHARQVLEQRVTERTRELSTLLEISSNVASTLELEPLLGLILDQLKTLVDYDGAALLALQDDAFVVLDYRGPIPREQARRVRFPLEL